MRQLRTVLTVIGCVAAAASSSCSSPHDDRGDLAVQVFLPQGVVLGAITYRLTGPGIDPIVEVVPVTGLPTTTFALFAGIPAGHGFEVAVSATSTDGRIPCASSARADLRAHRTTNLYIPLQCSGPPPDGHVVVTAALGECPRITALVAAPAVTSVGGQVDLSVEALVGDAGVSTFAWTAGSGTFSDPAAQTTRFTCTVPGSVTVTVTATNDACPDHVSITVTCVAPSP